MASQRTEPATPRKLSRARRRGEVWRSQELTSAVMILATAVGSIWYGPFVLNQLATLTRWIFTSTFSASAPTPETVIDAALSTLVTSLAPVFAVTLVVSISVGMVQVRPLFTLEALKPKFGRLAPMAGYRKIFGAYGAAKASLSATKLIALVAVFLWTVGDHLRDVILLLRVPPETALDVVGSVLLSFLFRSAFVLIALSLVDVVFERHHFLKGQRMTREELRREQRETEGDQSQKGERRRVHRELAGTVGGTGK